MGERLISILPSVSSQARFAQAGHNVSNFWALKGTILYLSSKNNTKEFPIE